MSPRKYYAIAKGVKPGIYDSWPIAEEQVKGFPRAKFKGFPTRDEAQKWLDTLRDGSSIRKRRASLPTNNDTVFKEGNVTIFTDGSALNNPGAGGYGVVMIYLDDRKEFSGGYRHTTNNRMELMGCIMALRKLEHRIRAVTINSDSTYVVQGINRGWAEKWKKKGWTKSDQQHVKNMDLWGELTDLVEGLDITFKWVRGHSDHPMNERCDKLAVAAARQDNLPLDPGYPVEKGKEGGDSWLTNEKYFKIDHDTGAFSEMSLGSLDFSMFEKP